MRIVIHKKTGNVYSIVHDNVIECTNGREDRKYVVYQNEAGMLFCREAGEFWQKFDLAHLSQTI